MIRLAHFVPAALLIVFGTQVFADDQSQSVSELLAPLVEQNNGAALAVAVIEGDRVTKIGAAGLRARGTKEAVELNDLWHLGSFTKAMTATLCARLIEQRKLNLRHKGR